jgi:hypothetical protein
MSNKKMSNKKQIAKWVEKYRQTQAFPRLDHGVVNTHPKFKIPVLSVRSNIGQKLDFKKIVEDGNKRWLKQQNKNKIPNLLG